MKAFDETYAGEDTAADRPCSDFDWADVMERLGEETRDLPASEIARLGEALLSIMDFVVGSGPITRGKAKIVGRKTLAFFWLLRPERFEGRSLTRLARELGVSPAALAVVTGNFSRRFGLRFRQQKQSSGVFKHSQTKTRHSA